MFDSETMWNAVISNDSRFDGAFFYGVLTTGIFCKPSCSSRAPKRENVEFFAEIPAAKKRGLRDCKRCKPLAAEPTESVILVVKACEFIAEDLTRTLDSVAAELKTSVSSLQKQFRSLLGISPKKYAENLRLQQFKNGVSAGDRIVDAMYDAGFGSSRGLYENADSKLGMTPKTYARKGKNMKIEYTVVNCDLGKLLVARTEKGVCSVTLGDDDAKMVKDLVKEFANAEIYENKEHLREFVAAILANLSGTKKILDIPLDIRATAFQMRVWEALRKIPYGKTVSYSDIAAEIGNEKAVRAVATACASNRIALAIPCHRVIGKGGNLSGYRWGIERKKTILDREKSATEN